MDSMTPKWTKMESSYGSYGAAQPVNALMQLAKAAEEAGEEPLDHGGLDAATNLMDLRCLAVQQTGTSIG